MMSSSPSALKGPRLTLMVNTNQLSRLDTGSTTPRSISQTPSSTTADFGENLELDHSATERVFRVLSSKDSTPHPGFEDDEPQMPMAETPLVRKPRPVVNKMLNEKINKFLNNITQVSADTNKELVQENRGLHQRVVALERNEHHLIKSLRENQTALRKQFDEELHDKQETLEARIRELEKQLAEKDGRISELSAQVMPAPTPVVAGAMTDADIATWYETRSKSWVTWVDEFAHPSPNRMAELHPLQQHEVIEGVGNFVRLTDDGRLPMPLAAGVKGNNPSLNTTQLLLQGMLNDFIVAEVLESPFWVFSALSKQGFDVESPMMQGSRGSDSQLSPMAFRLDMASFSNDGVPAPMPSPFTIPPAPTTARSISMLSPRHAPPMFTPLSSLSINTKGLSMQYCLPTKGDMEDLVTLMARTQQKDGDALAWRAQLMQTLAEGGLSRDPCHPSMADNEDKQMLAEARREYARQLKERFLGSAARFFLRDQDAHGIAKLEGRLVSELDLALRFSAQAWSRPSAFCFVGLRQLGSNAGPARRFKAGDGVVEACKAQQHEFDTDEKQVVMVLRAALGTMKKVGGPGKVWAKAQVVGAPVSPTKPLKVQITTRTPLVGGLSLDLLPSIHAVQAFMAAKNARSPQSTVTTPVTAELRINVSSMQTIATKATEED